MTPSQAIFVALVTDGMQRAQRAAEMVWEETNEWVHPILWAEDGELDAADTNNLPWIAFGASDFDIMSEDIAAITAPLGELVVMAKEVARLAGQTDRTKKKAKGRPAKRGPS